MRRSREDQQGFFALANPPNVSVKAVNIKEPWSQQGSHHLVVSLTNSGKTAARDVCLVAEHSPLSSLVNVCVDGMPGVIPAGETWDVSLPSSFQYETGDVPPSSIVTLDPGIERYEETDGPGTFSLTVTYNDAINSKFSNTTYHYPFYSVELLKSLEGS